jgi:hypothetical protein
MLYDSFGVRADSAAWVQRLRVVVHATVSNNEVKKLERSSIPIYFCAALFELENLESV